jgi:aryl-alcohol dehydrogenase-like predicted oxidoreductase
MTVSPPLPVLRPAAGLRRRRLLQALAALPLAGAPAMAAEPAALLRRAIPRSGETLPVVGLGTWQVFDVAADGAELGELRDVVREFTAAGARVIDSSPMYGRAEARVGDLTAAPGLREKLFLATKVWTSGRQAGIDQMQASMQAMRARQIDLIQVHNLLDVAVHTRTLREWKDAGRIRYLGITHYHADAYPALETLLKTGAYDCVQFNYSMAERDAEARLLDAAAASGTAVIVNRPFAFGGLFPRVRGRALPAWAAEFDCTNWAQFFLKYLLAHPAVTCVIPGTGKAAHMRDNLAAGRGRLPDAAMRRRMVAHLESL